MQRPLTNVFKAWRRADDNVFCGKCKSRRVVDTAEKIRRSPSCGASFALQKNVAVYNVARLCLEACAPGTLGRRRSARRLTLLPRALPLLYTTRPLRASLFTHHPRTHKRPSRVRICPRHHRLVGKRSGHRLPSTATHARIDHTAVSSEIVGGTPPPHHPSPPPLAPIPEVSLRWTS